MIEFEDVEKANSAHAVNFTFNGDWQDKRGFSNDCMIQIARFGEMVYNRDYEEEFDPEGSLMCVIWWAFQLGYEMGLEFGVQNEHE